MFCSEICLMMFRLHSLMELIDLGLEVIKLRCHVRDVVSKGGCSSVLLGCRSGFSDGCIGAR